MIWPQRLRSFSQIAQTGTKTKPKPRGRKPPMVGGTTLPDEAEPGIGTRQTQAVLRVPNNRPLRGWRANASPRDRKGRISEVMR